MDHSTLKHLFHESMPIFIALGDEIRLTIIESLADAALKNCGNNFSVKNLSRHGMNVRQITEKTSLSRPAISHHLKLLREAGIVGVSRRGTSNFYYLTIASSTKTLISLGNELESLLGEE